LHPGEDPIDWESDPIASSVCRTAFLNQGADELLDVFPNVTECVFIAARRVAQYALEHNAGSIGETVFAQVNDDVEIVQIERRDVFRGESGGERNPFFVHDPAGPPRDAGRWTDSGAMRLQNVTAVSSGKALCHLTATRIAEANK
jgi:hypothetical protein